MDDLKPRKPWHHGQTGTTGSELDEMDDFANVKRLDETWPKDKDGSKLSLGNSVAHTYEEMEEGIITTSRGYNDPPEDPVKSERQRRAMYAAKAGHSNLGIPQSVGAEMIEKSHGIKNLPETKHKKR
jgi:hypothetical protein